MKNNPKSLPSLALQMRKDIITDLMTAAVLKPFLLMKLKKFLLPLVAGGSLVFLSCGEKKDPADSPADGGNDETNSATASATDS